MTHILALDQGTTSSRAIVFRLDGRVGMTLGAPEQYDASCQSMARATGVRVISVAYRLAPEHPWPAQKIDCLAGAEWVISDSDLPVVIGGESAGAHLALVTALNLRDRGLANQ